MLYRNLVAILFLLVKHMILPLGFFSTSLLAALMVMTARTLHIVRLLEVLQ